MEGEERAEGIVRLFFDKRLNEAGEPPGLRRAVVDGLAAHGDDLIRRCREQIEHLRSPSSRRIPDAYFADEAEAENELQTAAAGMRVALALEGMLVEDPRAFERELARSVAPTALWSIRQEASLVPRPATRVAALEWSRAPIPWVENEDEWPPAGAEGLADKRQLEGGAGTPARVAEEPYVDWVQLGMIERQRTLSVRYPEKPARQMLVTTGLEATNGPPPERSLPLSSAPADAWVSPFESLAPDPTPASARTILSEISGPLVAVVGHGSRANSSQENCGVGLHPFSLVPVLAIVACLSLRPESQPVRSVLVDDRGPACVGRLWRGFLVHDGNYTPLEPGIEGADLILRQDLFEKLEDIVGPDRLGVGLSVSYSESDDSTVEST